MEHYLNFFLALSGRFDWLGNWLFFFISLIECTPFLGSFFPGGTLISIGSFFAAQGLFNIWGLALFAVMGALAGDYAGYCTGRWGRGWLEKKGFIKKAWLDKGEEFFIKYGNKSLLWGRFLGATRAVVPFVAGVSKMKSGPFLLWSFLGSILGAAWNIGLGYFSGNLIFFIIKGWSGHLSAALSILAVIALIYLTIKKHGESYWEYFKHISLDFMDNVFSSQPFQAAFRRSPALQEILNVKKIQEKFFAGFLALTILILAYIFIVIKNSL